MPGQPSGGLRRAARDALHRHVRSYTPNWFATDGTAALKRDAVAGDTETNAAYTGKAGRCSEPAAGTRAAAQHASGKFLAAATLEATFMTNPVTTNL